MKFNWGTGIFVFIVVFILVNIAFFIFISTLDINLVEDDYYEKELAYQEKIDKIANARSLSDQVRVKIAKDSIVIWYPSITSGKSPEGNILFFRPSDPGMDLEIPVSINELSAQTINAALLIPGRYIVKIDWSLEGVKYYHEESIVVVN